MKEFFLLIDWKDLWKEEFVDLSIFLEELEEHLAVGGGWGHLLCVSIWEQFIEQVNNNVFVVFGDLMVEGRWLLSSMKRRKNI